MKRDILIGFILVIFSMIFSIHVLKNLSADNFKGEVEKGAETIEQFKENLDSSKEKVQEKKLEYLSGEYKRILLENKFFSAIDSSFSQISVFFRYTLGIDYSFSLTFFFVLFVFFFFVLNLNMLFKGVSLFPSWVSFLLSLAISILLGNIGFFEKLAALSFVLFNAFLGFVKFTLIATILFIIIMIVLFLFFRGSFKSISLFLAKKYKSLLEEKAKQDMKEIENFNKKIKEISNI